MATWTDARPNVYSLSDPQIQDIRDAYAQMQSRSYPDPISFGWLAGFHAGYGLDPKQGEGYCTHHKIEFLPWHRKLIHEFELALQKASGNSKIKLPYWDWFHKNSDGNYQGIPKILSDKTYKKNGVDTPNPLYSALCENGRNRKKKSSSNYQKS